MNSSTFSALLADTATYSPEVKITLFIIFGLIGIVTTFGNLLVILAVALVKKLRTSSNFLIVSLAVSDFLVGILAIPLATISTVVGPQSLAGRPCDLYIASDVLLCTASILNLCAISIDRYLAITKPLRYAARRTPRRMMLMIVLTWVLSAMISLPPMFSFSHSGSTEDCVYPDNIFYQIYATFSAFFIPLIVMVILYGRIFVLARRMAKDLEKQKRAAEAAVSLHSSNYTQNQSATESIAKPEQAAATRRTSGFRGSIAENGTRMSQTQPVEQYPLPPSELCRRRRPRPLHSNETINDSSDVPLLEQEAVSSVTLTPNLSDLPVTQQDKEKNASTLTLVEEFERRVERNRSLRSVFLSSPPSRQNSTIVLRNTRITQPSTTNDVEYRPKQSPDLRSHSMRDAERKPLVPHERPTTFQPPKLSISYYNEDNDIVMDSPVKENNAITDIERVSVGRDSYQSRTPIPRPKRRPLYGTRQSASSVADFSHKRHQGRHTVLNFPSFFSSDRRSSTPILEHSSWYRKGSDATAVAQTPAEERVLNETLVQPKEQPILEADPTHVITRNSNTVRQRTLSFVGTKPSKKKRGSRGHSESKAIKTLGVIMGCFILCWLPFFIIALIDPIYTHTHGVKFQISDHIRSFALWLGYINSTINPIIYAIFNREFRIPFREILACRCRDINARLRSQRYAVEYGLSTASAMGQQQFTVNTQSIMDNGQLTKRRQNRNTLDIDSLGNRSSMGPNRLQRKSSYR